MKNHLMLISLECWPQSSGEWFGNRRLIDAPESAFVRASRAANGEEIDMACLATRMTRGIAGMTPHQIRALLNLHDFARGTDRWTRGDYLEARDRAALSSLIVWRLVEGKQIKAARRTDYRLTAAGIARAAEILAMREARKASKDRWEAYKLAHPDWRTESEPL